jgi:hypothetical protein
VTQTGQAKITVKLCKGVVKDAGRTFAADNCSVWNQSGMRNVYQGVTGGVLATIYLYSIFYVCNIDRSAGENVLHACYILSKAM